MATNVSTLEPHHYKYLFLTSYFHFKEDQHVPNEAMAFIRNYLNCNFDQVDDRVLRNYLGYITNMRLKNVIADTSVDIYKFIKPQFRFVSDRASVDILEFDSRVYIKPGVSVFATNFFTSKPAKILPFLYAEFTKVYKDKLFVNNTGMGCILVGSAGFLFEDAFVDWSGVRMCAAPRVQNNMHPFRLYLIGEDMANHFATNNILPPILKNVKPNRNNPLFMLKNFYKGLPLFKINYTIVNSTKIQTRKPNRVFDEINKELNNNCPFVKFIQRDYIYDAEFPSDLTELLNEYMTETSVMKYITKFIIEDPANICDLTREIIIDRYTVDCYKKLFIKRELTNRFPAMFDNESSFIFVTNEMIQIKGTLNAFYAPKHRLLGILATNRLFGSTETIDFHPNLLVYKQSSPPQRLNGEVYLVDKNQKVFLVFHLFSNTVPAYLLVRGDYESSSELKSLRDLSPWVQNTILKLLIRDSQITVA
jgi:Baculovirus Y142 protein